MKNFSDGGDKESLCVQQSFRFQRFLEAYKDATTVDVCTSFDLHSDPSVLDGVTLFVSVGHDEYWSNEMRNKVQAFVAAGNNAAFFSGNTAWWKVRFEDNARTMVCYKSIVEDPLASDPENLTGHFCDAPGAGAPTGLANREENTLTGVSYRRGVLLGSNTFSYTILDAANDSAWGGYGIAYLAGFETLPPDFLPASYGMTFGLGVFQLEMDGADYDLVPPGTGAPVLTGRDGTPSNFRILAALDVRGSTTITQRGVATLGYYTNVGTVFTAATTDWVP